MARPLRLEFPGAIYHLTGRGNARQKVFFTDADRELFLSTLTGVVNRYHWICRAYCLMANHYHLLATKEVKYLDDTHRVSIQHAAKGGAMATNTGHAEMPYRVLGSTKERVSAIGLGG
jgi:REP element-mobilizing transposase RayT